MWPLSQRLLWCANSSFFESVLREKPSPMNLWMRPNFVPISERCELWACLVLVLIQFSHAGMKNFSSVYRFFSVLACFRCVFSRGSSICIIILGGLYILWYVRMMQTNYLGSYQWFFGHSLGMASQIYYIAASSSSSFEADGCRKVCQTSKHAKVASFCVICVDWRICLCIQGSRACFDEGLSFVDCIHAGEITYRWHCHHSVEMLKACIHGIDEIAWFLVILKSFFLIRC